MVQESHFGSGSGSKPNRCQIRSPGCQETEMVHSGTVRWYTLNPSEFGWLSVGHPGGPAIDSYQALAYAVC